MPSLIKCGMDNVEMLKSLGVAPGLYSEKHGGVFALLNEEQREKLAGFSADFVVVDPPTLARSARLTQACDICPGQWIYLYDGKEKLRVLSIETAERDGHVNLKVDTGWGALEEAATREDLGLDLFWTSDDCTWPIWPTPQVEPEVKKEPRPELFGYYINLDERGEFYADVRNRNEDTIFEVHSNEEGVVELIEDGFMKHTCDLAGLSEHLSSIGFIPKGAIIHPMGEFEEMLAAETEDEDLSPSV